MHCSLHPTVSFTQKFTASPAAAEKQKVHGLHCCRHHRRPQPSASWHHPQLQPSPAAGPSKPQGGMNDHVGAAGWSTGEG